MINTETITLNLRPPLRLFRIAFLGLLIIAFLAGMAWFVYALLKPHLNPNLPPTIMGLVISAFAVLGWWLIISKMIYKVALTNDTLSMYNGRGQQSIDLMQLASVQQKQIVPGIFTSDPVLGWALYDTGNGHVDLDLYNFSLNTRHQLYEPLKKILQKTKVPIGDEELHIWKMWFDIGNEQDEYFTRPE